MSDNENLGLLDLEDDVDLMDLSPSDPFANVPRPKRPWVLLGIAIVVIVLATYIIIRVVGRNSDDSVDINLDRPVVVDTQNPSDAAEDSNFEKDADKLIVGGDVKPVTVTEQKPAQIEPVGMPVRVVEDRGDVTFNPNAGAVPAVPKPRPASRPNTAATPAVAPVVSAPVKPATAANPSGTWYVQFGSYSTRALAEAGQKKIVSNHKSLLSNTSFVILAAVLPDGKTVYRLRATGFASSGAAGGFCNNAKSDGLECYVTK